MTNALFQNSFYIGNNFNGILYGVELVLYFMTMHRLLKTNGGCRTQLDKFFMFFSTALLVLITIFVSVESVFGEEMWIIHADYPGGSAAYLEAEASVWYQTMGTAASVILNLLSDGLLIYRCLIVWNDYRVIIFPCFLWIATLALCVAQLYVTGVPNADFFAGLAAKVTLAYFSTSIGLNTIVTCIVCGRILVLARRTKTHLNGISRTYYSITSIIIESALPYSLSGIAFLVSSGLHSGISILFLSLFTMFTCVSPQMLVLRVVAGRGWTVGNTTEIRSGIALSPILPTHYAYGNDCTAVHLQSMALGHSEVTSSDINKSPI